MVTVHCLFLGKGRGGVGGPRGQKGRKRVQEEVWLLRRRVGDPEYMNYPNRIREGCRNLNREGNISIKWERWQQRDLRGGAITP